MHRSMYMPPKSPVLRSYTANAASSLSQSSFNLNFKFVRLVKNDLDSSMNVLQENKRMVGSEGFHNGMMLFKNNRHTFIEGDSFQNNADRFSIVFLSQKIQ